MVGKILFKYFIYFHPPDLVILFLLFPSPTLPTSPHGNQQKITWVRKKHGPSLRVDYIRVRGTETEDKILSIFTLKGEGWIIEGMLKKRKWLQNSMKPHRMGV
jgi:hypothetical protein